MKTLLNVCAAWLWVCGGIGHGAVYLDARGGSGGNTVRSSDGHVSAWFTSSTAVDSLWAQRAFGYDANMNVGTTSGVHNIFEASGTYGGEDAVAIITTISGLTAGQTYEVSVVYWSATSANWTVRAGFSLGSLMYFDRTGSGGATAGTQIGSQGDRVALRGTIGETTADANGQIRVYIDDKPGTGHADRTWYDGLLYAWVNVPYNPVPADGATEISQTTTLSFEPMRNPSNPAAPNPNIASHRVYLGKSAVLNHPADLLATLPAATLSVATPTLDGGTVYYWRVDEVLNDNSVVTGRVWSFETVGTLPDFNPPAGMQPVNQLVDVHTPAVFTAIAGNDPDSYQWYKGQRGDTSEPVTDEAGRVQGATTSELTIVAEAGDEGFYWCRAENEAGFADSLAAALAVRRVAAYWSLDEADFDSGVHPDGSGNGHHAAPSATPQFTAGVNGEGVQIRDIGDAARVGTWDPALYSGQLTISLWAKWDGVNGAVQGLIGKRTAWAVGQMMWQLDVNAAGHTLAFRSTAGGNVGSSGLPEGEWVHLIVTFDGATARLYRNGETAASGPFATGSKSDAILVLGACGVNAADMTELAFNGALDEIVIFNYAISPTDAAELHLQILPDAAVCVARPAFDFTGPQGVPDCVVNLYDFAELASFWMACTAVPESECGH